MENMNIFQNPGLQHITENILLNVDLDDLPKCQLLNKSCQDILDNPMFWTKKLRMLKYYQRKTTLIVSWHSNGTQILTSCCGCLDVPYS